MNWKHSPLLIAVAFANLGALIAAPLVAFSLGGPMHSLAALPYTLAYALVYGNAIAVIAGLTVPRLVCAVMSRPRLVPVAVVAGSIVSAAAGSFIGQAILAALRISTWATFWPEFFVTLKITVFMASVFGMGSFFHAATKEQLRQVTLQLRERELAEERARKLALEARLASLESRLRPHFLFNALNSVAALIPADPGRAEEMLTRLSRLLRTALDNTQSTLVSLDQELRITEEYLAIERMRLGDDLQIRIDVPESLRSVRVPPFSIQPLAENAVKHGISQIRQPGQITITAEAIDGSVRVLVSDNGPGFDLGELRSGRGLDMLAARLSALFGNGARLNVLRQDSRCMVEFVVPGP